MASDGSRIGAQMTLSSLRELAKQATPITTCLEDAGTDQVGWQLHMWSDLGIDEDIGDFSAKFYREASPTVIKLLDVIETYEKALHYYSKVYPEWNAQVFTERARTALARAEEILK